MSERPTHLRTPYRWDLTPRQREVLDLIARGRTNAEIADELGITLDGAKYHVREILGKLGAESREEAVALWTQRQRPLARLARAFAALLAGGGLRWLALAAGMATIAVGFVVLAVLLTRGDDGERPAQGDTPPPMATPSQQVVVPGGDTCTEDDYAPLAIARRRDGMLITEVRIALQRPCRVEGDVMVDIVDGPDGASISEIRGNPARLPVEFEAPVSGDYLVAEGRWENWCTEAFASQIEVTVLGKMVSEPMPGITPTPPDCRDASTPSLLTLVPKDPLADWPTLPACDPGMLTLHLAPSGPQDPRLFLTVDAPAPCQLEADATATLYGPDGQRAGFKVNGVVAHLSIDLPTQEPIAYVDWTNWCEDPTGPFTLEVTLGSVSTRAAYPATPECQGDWEPRLTFDQSAPPIQREVPLPAGFERVWSPPSPVPVWIYESANPASSACIEIADAIVPLALAGKIPAKPFECDGETWRIAFAVDVTGRHYLLGVNILVLAQVTLPSGRTGDGTCDSIRDHLVPASMSADDAAYVTVCDVLPTPPGQPSAGEPLVIWARIRTDMAPPSVPPETPCWQLARYLGAASEAELLDVQCTLDPNSTPAIPKIAGPTPNVVPPEHSFCAEDAAACEVAIAVGNAARDGRAEDIIALAAPLRDVPCTATPERQPVCAGRSGTAEGFNLSTYGKAASLVPLEEFQDRLTMLFGERRPAELLSIGCPQPDPTSPPTCAPGFAVAVEYQGQAAMVLLFARHESGGFTLFGLYPGGPLDSELSMANGGPGGIAGVFPGGVVGMSYYFQRWADAR